MMTMDRDLLRNLLRWEGVDAVLVCRPWETTFQPNVQYLLGHMLREWDYSGLFVLLRGDGSPVVVANSWCPSDPMGDIEVRTYPGYHMRFALSVLSATLRDLGLTRARIGIESTSLSVALFDELRAANPGIAFVAGDRVFTRLRMHKSPSEVTAIRTAVSVAEEAIMAAVATLKPGNHLVDIEAAARAVSSPKGARILSTHVTTYLPDGAERVDLPPLITPDTVLTFDVIATHDSYRADMARQIVYGDLPDQTLERMSAVAAMQDAMIGAIRPGMPLRDAYDGATRAATPWAGGDSSFTFQLHGIGLETHEPPRFCSSNAPYFPLPDEGALDDVPFGPQTVVCLELGIGGAWTEDLFLLAADGTERLTTLPRTIMAP